MSGETSVACSCVQLKLLKVLLGCGPNSKSHSHQSFLCGLCLWLMKFVSLNKVLTLSIYKSERDVSVKKRDTLLATEQEMHQSLRYLK